MKVRLKITTLKTGSRIRSVPKKKLTEMVAMKRRSWQLRGEWLVLEAFG